MRLEQDSFQAYIGSRCERCLTWLGR